MKPKVKMRITATLGNCVYAVGSTKPRPGESSLSGQTYVVVVGRKK